MDLGKIAGIGGFGLAGLLASGKGGDIARNGGLGLAGLLLAGKKKPDQVAPTGLPGSLLTPEHAMLNVDGLGGSSGDEASYDMAQRSGGMSFAPDMRPVDVPEIKTPRSSVMEAMRSPLGQFGMNMLAQDGYSTTPGPGVGAQIAKAGMATMQQQDAQDDRQFERGVKTDAASLARLKAALDARRANRPEIRSAGSDIVSIDPDTGESKALYRGQPDPTTLQRNFGTWKAMPPGPERDRFGVALQGYANTDEGRAAKVATAGQVAEVQGQARDRHRAPARVAAAKPPKVERTAVVNGKLAYRINGQWFDNPEGR